MLYSDRMNEDLLSNVLRTVRLRSAVYFQVSGQGQWAAETLPGREIAATVMSGSEHVMEFHVVTRGQCWVSVAGEAPVRLEQHDLVVLAQGDGHVMSSAPDLRAMPPDPAFIAHCKRGKLPFAYHLGGAPVCHVSAYNGDAETLLVCGFLGCDLRPFNPLIASLPRLLVLRGGGSSAWIAQVMQRAATESREARVGSAAMLERMSEMMFVDAMRRYMEQLPAHSQGRLAGLRDTTIARALALIHQDPSMEWTVDELGRQVGLARTAMHERFSEVVGLPPMQYVANWRMQVAANLLRDSADKVSMIAQEVGYGSEAAFSRAFKRMAGLSPAAWRRTTKSGS
jgi:AraC-like DNA-binding protein